MAEENIEEKIEEKSEANQKINNAKQNKTMALFFAIYCWHYKLDGLHISRKDMCRLFGVKKSIRDSRIDEFLEDIKGYFSHSQKIFLRGTLDSIVISKEEFTLFLEPMTDEDRRDAIYVQDDLCIKPIKLWPEDSYTALGYECRDDLVFDLIVSLLARGGTDPEQLSLGIYLQMSPDSDS